MCDSETPEARTLNRWNAILPKGGVKDPDAHIPLPDYRGINECNQKQAVIWALDELASRAEQERSGSLIIGRCRR